MKVPAVPPRRDRAFRRRRIKQNTIGDYDERAIYLKMDMDRFNNLIDTGVREGFSDIHITGGHPLVFRKEGRIHFDRTGKWSYEEVDELVKSLLTPGQMQALKKRLSVDFARSIHLARIRINIFYTTRGLSLAIRLLPGTVPSINSLNLHPSLQQFCKLPSGLILICGSTGSGKSTTIAAMIEEINKTRAAHIITLEDPIEYRFLSKRSFIEQRELGAHIPSFKRGLLDVLREDPDVILVGELREAETMRLTLNAVESGHLVFASLHATNSEDALYRITNSFPLEAQDIVHGQLSSTLALLVVQKLIYLDRVGFRVPLLSILRSTQSIKGIIRDNRLPQLESVIQTGKAEGMFTMEKYRKEYLDKCEFFTPPSVNFRPSEEATQEIIYHSPLMDTKVQTLKFEKVDYEKEEIQEISSGRPQNESVHCVEIDEEASLEEMIEQIRKSDKYK